MFPMNWTDSFNRSIYHAAYRDLRKDGREEPLMVMAAYTETFPNTSMGRGGIAGQAITYALTVAIHATVGEKAQVAVYRCGKLDYLIPDVTDEIWMRIVHQQIPYYKDRHEVGGLTYEELYESWETDIGV